ncbi:hypothetical protein HUO09_16775 [Vibrio sp. Y2-5]|uniref:hypothetical protein n=1 Tax=Vibrio sp. Y2-5 TaxID=2743977 RepID=UPI0016606D8F|nr:hypothetical protein [Vibrio sp. Y2-5]MBD0788009.1 hypothetical protein [Vibrio sp. Y2-5]
MSNLIDSKQLGKLIHLRDSATSDMYKLVANQMVSAINVKDANSFEQAIGVLQALNLSPDELLKKMVLILKEKA